MDAGTRWARRTENAQRRSPITVVLVSRHYDAAHYLHEEVDIAVELSRSQPSQHRLVPVVVDDSVAALPYGMRQLQSMRVGTDQTLLDIAVDLRRALASMKVRSRRRGVIGMTDESMVEAVSRGLVSDHHVAEVNRILVDVEKWLAGVGSACMFFTDVDGTTRINDLFGSGVGDRVLDVVHGMQESHFDAGPTFRLGADEFLSCAEGASVPDGVARARALRDAVELKEWSYIRSGLFVTVSMGVAKIDMQREAADAAIVRAIMGSQMAKRRGGNRVRKGPEELPKHTERFIHRYLSS